MGFGYDAFGNLVFIPSILDVTPPFQPVTPYFMPQMDPFGRDIRLCTVHDPINHDYIKPDGRYDRKKFYAAYPSMTPHQIDEALRKGGFQIVFADDSDSDSGKRGSSKKAGSKAPSAAPAGGSKLASKSPSKSPSKSTSKSASGGGSQNMRGCTSGSKGQGSSAGSKAGSKAGSQAAGSQAA